MKNAKIRLRVHIIPVGKDTVDRVLAPLQKFPPEKVYLLTVSFNDAFEEEYMQVKRYLEENFRLIDNIVEKKVNYYNLIEFMELIAQICYMEQKENNEIYFSISGGTMITVAGTLATILFGVIPYFAKFDYNTKKLSDIFSIPEVPSLILNKLKEDQVQLLAALDEFDKINNEKSINKGICIDLIHILSLFPEISDKKPGDYNKLKIHYLKELKDLDYIIEVDRNTIKLTEKGIFAARVLATYRGVNRIEIHKLIQRI